MKTMHHQLERLERLVEATIVQLMDAGGTYPYITCDLVAEEATDLYNLLGEDRVFALCERIQRSDVPVESACLQEMFRSFNSKYFGGRLPEHEVQVVYDIEAWVGQDTSRDVKSGYLDPDLHRIVIRLSELRGIMICSLIKEMACAASSPFDHNKWVTEMSRLKELGAPIGDWPIEVGWP